MSEEEPEIRGPCDFTSKVVTTKQYLKYEWDKGSSEFSDSDEEQQEMV